ncbi:unnamed protein product [Ranitomeya imitator]|uniref:Acyloxyacyl hydrolase n=1 Tax=Ranitomeya imitator TaxID=111125 RepID=A0ABN9LLP0_9NEOB|nr:unnamed protein product [Ranitomeya imitator]
MSIAAALLVVNSVVELPPVVVNGTSASSVYGLPLVAVSRAAASEVPSTEQKHLSFSMLFPSDIVFLFFRGWTQSLYLRLRDWNRCNHRDYQNIARNGGSSGNLHSYLTSMARNQQLDKPAIVFYAMIGNDVCNPSVDTLKSMTTPKEMRTNVLKELKYLDMNLPKGSHVILVSLADGRFLWNTLHDRYHPLGQLNKDITYEQFYGFLSCVKTNPCEGWMNKNETLRNLTTEVGFMLYTKYSIYFWL